MIKHVLDAVICPGALFSDPEWEAAEKSNEKPRYYMLKTEKGIVVRKYKPAIAVLVMERTGWILEPLN